MVEIPSGILEILPKNHQIFEDLSQAFSAPTALPDILRISCLERCKYRCQTASKYRWDARSLWISCRLLGRFWMGLSMMPHCMHLSLCWVVPEKEGMWQVCCSEVPSPWLPLQVWAAWCLHFISILSVQTCYVFHQVRLWFWRCGVCICVWVQRAWVNIHHGLGLPEGAVALALLCQKSTCCLEEVLQFYCFFGSAFQKSSHCAKEHIEWNYLFSQRFCSPFFGLIFNLALFQVSGKTDLSGSQRWPW